MVQNELRKIILKSNIWLLYSYIVITIQYSILQYLNDLVIKILLH